MDLFAFADRAPFWESLLAELQRDLPFRGAGLLTAAVLILLLLVLLPRGDWKLARQPALFLGLYVGSLLLHSVFSGAAGLDIAFEYLALFFLLCSIGRSSFLLIFRSRLALRFIRPWPRIFLDIVQALIYCGALLLTLNAADVAPTSLVTGSALVTAAIGLSMKDTLGNLFAGLAIHTEHPFEVGDWIQFDQLAYHIGKVLEINWRATKLLTLDDVIVVVPNSQLAQAPIRNFTKPARHSRRSVFVTLPYDLPPQKMHRVILDAVADAWGVLKDPPPSVVTNGFNESGIEYWIRIFTEEFHRRDRVDGDVRDRVWYAMQRHGIALAFPRRDVQLQHVNSETEAEAAAERLAERREALHAIDFLDELPDRALHRLATDAECKVYAPGEVILRQGSAGEDLYIIRHGHVAVTVAGADGESHEVARLGPGEFFGEMSLLTGERRVATVTAVDDCEFLVVDRAALSPILAEAPELAEHISETLATRQQMLTERLGQLRSPPSRPPERPQDILQRIKDFFGI